MNEVNEEWINLFRNRPVKNTVIKPESIIDHKIEVISKKRKYIFIFKNSVNKQQIMAMMDKLQYVMTHDNQNLIGINQRLIARIICIDPNGMINEYENTDLESDKPFLSLKDIIM